MQVNGCNANTKHLPYQTSTELFFYQSYEQQLDLEDELQQQAALTHDYVKE